MEDVEFQESELSELVGETILSFEQIETPPGFWDDFEEKYEIKTTSGKVFYFQTSGGINIFGFPGSQCHNLIVYKSG